MRIEHIQRRIHEQMISVATIERAYTSLLRDGKESLTRQKIDSRLEMLKEDWEKFRINHVALNLALDKVTHEERCNLKQLDYFSQDVYFSTHELYLDSADKMMSLILDQTEEAPVNTPSSSCMFSQRPSYHYDPRLPRLTLPTYDGTQEQWLPFKELFESIVVANQSISTIEKLQYLKCSLKGQAAQLLDNTTLTAGNFATAWEKLIVIYENPRTLISSAIDAFLDLKKMTRENSSELQRIFASVSQTYQNLGNMRRPVHYWDDLWVQLIIRLKLDVQTVQAWEIYLGDSTEPPTWEKLSTFLSSRIRTLKAIEKSKQQSTSQSSVSSTLSHSRRSQFNAHYASQSNITNTKSSSDRQCFLCSELHMITRCPKYQLKTPTQRRELVTKNRLCYNCLGFHRISNCPSQNRCVKCGQKHHTSLHKLDSSKAQVKPESTSTKQVNHVHQVDHIANIRAVILSATARVKIVCSNGEAILARALLDQGSEISLASENLVQRLRIKKRPSSVPIMGIGAQKSGKSRGIASIIIKPHFQSLTEINIEAHVLPKLTTHTPSTYTIMPNWPHLQGLLLADPEYAKPGCVDLILGADIYGQLLDGSITQGPENSPVAQRTKLGWIISGPVHTTTESHSASTHHCTVDNDLYEMLERFWHQEEIKPPTSHQSLTIQEQECENHFVKTHKRNEYGRYIVRLPFKEAVQHIGDSRPSALRMMYHLYRTFERDPSFFEAYSNFLAEYEHLQHMTRVSSHQQQDKTTFYHPHHGVKRETSSTTKLRVVFNGSCKVSEGIPLSLTYRAKVSTRFA